MFESILGDSLTISSAMLCTVASIILGLVVAYTYMFTTVKKSKNFAISLAILPFLVQIVIMMVNGNLGTSVAILGAFGLVRFRSQPGNSKEIVNVFFSMAIGLACGMGQIIFASVMTIIVSCILIILSKTDFGEEKEENNTLKITVPEDVDYTCIFDEVFAKYTNRVRTERVKLTNLGSMYEITYTVNLKNGIKDKDFIDELRIRNANLNVMLYREYINESEL